MGDLGARTAFSATEFPEGIDADCAAGVSLMVAAAAAAITRTNTTPNNMAVRILNIFILLSLSYGFVQINLRSSLVSKSNSIKSKSIDENKAIIDIIKDSKSDGLLESRQYG
jgi:hypothetical protein